MHFSQKIKKYISRKVVVSFFILLVILISILAWPAQQALAFTTISTATTANAVTQGIGRKVVSTTDGYIVAFYWPSASSGLATLRYRTSNDGGSSWSAAINASTNGSNTKSSTFAVEIDSSNNILAVYPVDVNIVSKKLTYTGSGTWSLGSEITIATGTGSCVPPRVTYRNPGLALTTSGTWIVNITRQDESSGACPTITYSAVSARSTDGTTWSSLYNGADSGSSTSIGTPVVSIGNDVWSVFGNGTISKDIGATGSWTSTGTTVSNIDSLSRSITSAGSNEINIFYKNTSNSNLEYVKYTIGTNTLSSITTISSGTSDTLGSISSSTNGTLWAFYGSFVAASSFNLVYKSFQSGVWDTSATSITTDNLNNYSFTAQTHPQNGNLPVMWQEGTVTPWNIKVATLAVATNSTPAAPTLSLPASGATGVPALPRFELATTDADSDYLRYKIELCTTSNCSAILTTLTQPSGTPQGGWAAQDQQSATAYTGATTIGGSRTAIYFYQSTDPLLSPSTQYWWRAYAIDPAGTNTYSTASSISTFTTGTQEVRIQGGTTIQGGVKIGN